MVTASIRRATANKLRANSTPHERALWRALKELPTYGTHFRRQAPIGRYIVDFFCPAARLVVEIDGGHHNDDAAIEKDRIRQFWLEHEGYRVIRFWNSEITGNMTAVLDKIFVELHGSREAEPHQFKHQRRERKPGITPPRPLRGRPSPSRGG